MSDLIEVLFITLLNLMFMLKILNGIVVFALFVFLFTSCDRIASEESPRLIFKFKFDPNQERLGNFGEPQDLPFSHAAQTPIFNEMGAHYIELARENDIPVYNGVEVYKSPMTTKGGEEAIDFDQALYASDGEIFYSIDLSTIPSGEYEYLRISLSYQNYTIAFKHQDIELNGTIASFVGSNTYIDSYKVKNEEVKVRGNKLQGYWAFETDFPNIPVVEGQAPPGAITVPNPIHSFSPIPIGSCLVTGKFDSPLVVTGDESSDIVVVCSVSINNSFEWVDNNNNGTYEPMEGDQVIDMGVRGLIPFIE